MASSLVLTWIIICAVACAIAITSRPTTGQSLDTALTGNLCRVSSERFEYDVTTGIHIPHTDSVSIDAVNRLVDISTFVSISASDNRTLLHALSPSLVGLLLDNLLTLH